MKIKVTKTIGGCSIVVEFESTKGSLTKSEAIVLENILPGANVVERLEE